MSSEEEPQWRVALEDEKKLREIATELQEKPFMARRLAGRVRQTTPQADLQQQQ